MINVVQAFSVSMKHFLRGEPGIYYEDLYPLVCYLPRYIGSIFPSPDGSDGSLAKTQTDELPLWYQSDSRAVVRRLHRQKTFDPEKVLPHMKADRPLLPARNPPEMGFWYWFPFLLPFRWMAKGLSKRIRKRLADDPTTLSGKSRKPAHVESNVPLEIT